MMRNKARTTEARVLLVLLLCITLVLGLGTTVFAAGAHDHSAWTELSAGTLTSGNYYLADKTVLEGSVVIPAGVEVTICLNGNMLIGGETLKTSIFSVAGTLHICDCTGEGTLTAGTAENGGAFYVDGGTLTVEHIIISGCNATAKGGVVYATNGASVTITGGASVSGSAVDGGVAYATGAGTTVTITDANLFKGSATNGGGVYLANGAALCVEAFGEIETATAVNGGGVYATGTGTAVTVDDATISQNKATNGGGLYLADGALCTLQGDARIERCSATENGGAAFVNGGKLKIDTARLRLNTATNGAGIALQAGVANLTDATILENTASANGGGIYTTGAGTLSVLESTIRDNEAENGAGMYLVQNGAGSTLLQDATFRGNTATAKGGALYSNGIVKLAGEILMQHAGFQLNTAPIGGGVYLDANGVFMIAADIADTAISVNTSFASYKEKVLTTGLSTYHPDEEVTEFFVIEVNTLFADLIRNNAGEAVLRNITYTATLASGTYFGKDYSGTEKLQGLLGSLTIKQAIGNNTPAVITTDAYQISLAGEMTYAGAGVTINVQILNNVRVVKVASFVVTFTHRLSMPQVEGTYMFPDAVYNGSAQNRNYILCDDNKRGADWMAAMGITLSGNVQTNARTYTITATRGNTTDANGEHYAWASDAAMRATWVIRPYELTDSNVNFGNRFSFVYNGTSQGLTVTVKALGRTLAQGTEYTLAESKATNYRDGGYTATVTGVGNFTGTVTKSWMIEKANYNMSGVSFQNATFPYNGRLQHPAVTGLPNGLQVEYVGGATNVSESGAVVTAVFKTTNPNYNVPASKTARVYITPLAVTESNVTFTALSLTYNGTEQTVTVRSATVNGLQVTYTLTGNTATNWKDGGYTLTFTANGNFTGSFTKNWSIAKANYDMSGLSLTSKEFPYDGQSHTTVLVGTLPTGADGITLRAQTNGLSVTNVADGTKTVEITFATDSQNYNVPTAMRATIKITPLVLTESHVSFGQTQFTYSGAVNTVTVTVAQIGGLDVTYTVTENTATNYREGGYTVKVKANGNFTGEVTKAWSIEKATYDLSGIVFENGVFVESGRAFNLSITGALPAGVRVSYENNGQKLPGVYTVTAKFTGDALNYHPIADMTATLTVRIARMEYTMEGTDSTLPHAIIEAVDGFAPDTVMKVEETGLDAYPDVDDILLIYHISTTVAPDGKVRVQLLVPGYFAEEEITFKLMHDNGDGLKEVSYEVFANSSYIELEVDRLGDFLFVEDRPISIFLVIGLIAIVPVVGIAIAAASSKGGTGKKGTAAKK